MAARKKRNPSLPSIKTSSEASNPRKPMQAKTAASSVCSSSSSFHKGKRGRPKKLVMATRGNGDLKCSIIKSPSGTTVTFTTNKKVANPEIPNSKNEKLEIASASIAGEVALKDTAIPQQSSTPAAINEGAPGDSSSDSIQPPSPPNLKGKKSPRKGKPNRAPFS